MSVFLSIYMHSNYFKNFWEKHGHLVHHLSPYSLRRYKKKKKNKRKNNHQRNPDKSIKKKKKKNNNKKTQKPFRFQNKHKGYWKQWDLVQSLEERTEIKKQGERWDSSAQSHPTSTRKYFLKVKSSLSSAKHVYICNNECRNWNGKGWR